MNPNPDPTIVRQIRALLNLTTARGATEAEAATAATKAQELLLRHDLHRLQIDAPAETPIQETVIERHQGGRVTGWKAALLAGIAEAFHCVSYRAWEQGRRTLTLVGREANTAAAQTAYAYICACIERETARHKWEGDRRASDSFRKGMVARITTRLRARRAEIAREGDAGTALAVLSLTERAQLEADRYHAERNQKIGQPRPIHFSSDDAFRRGVRAADALNLDDPLPAGAHRAPAALGTG